MKIAQWIREHLLDPHAHENPGRYVLQCAIATTAVVITLLLLDVIRQAAIVSSIGATAFITFTQPHSHASRSRSLLGGYVVGTIVGLLFSGVGELLLLLSDGRYELIFAGVAGALAVGISMLIMVLTNTEHPPAAGLALGIVVHAWDFATLAVILLGVVVLYAAKSALKGYLIDLR